MDSDKAARLETFSVDKTVSKWELDEVVLKVRQQEDVSVALMGTYWVGRTGVG